MSKGVIKSMISGFVGRMQRRSTATRFPKISWLKRKLLKHQDAMEIKKISISNLTIWYKKPYELSYTYDALFQLELYRFQTDSQKPLIIDCGSNIGLSILYFKQIFPNAVIHAFEADADNFTLLQKNVRENNLTGIHLNQCAIWIENGFVSFHSDSSEASHISENNGGTKVPSKRLSGILQQYEKVDFLKMDIEGAEWDVLNECASCLCRVENMFIEYHGKVTESRKLADLLNIVAGQGFKIYVNHATDNLSQPFNKKNTPYPYDIQLHLFCYK